MKTRKTSMFATAAAVIATTIFGVAPASAAETVLPEGASGGDTSAIRYLACEDRLIFSIPLNVDFDGSLPFEGDYSEYTTRVTLAGQEKFYYASDAKRTRSQGFFEYTDKTPGEVIEVGFSSNGYGDDTTPVFDIDVTVVDSDAFAGGSGTYSDPYLISNVNQLNLVRCHDNAHFKLTKNLNMEGRTWMPIGQEDENNYDGAWEGSFDGAGFTISNLTIENEYQEEVALFGSAEYSMFSNLKLKNFEIGGDYRVGTLVGRGRQNSYSNISLVSSKVVGREDMGLLFGHSDYRNSYSEISVQGEIVASPFYSQTLRVDWYEDAFYYNGIEGIGGVVGYEDGDGALWEDIKTDVKISFEVDPAVAAVIDSDINKYGLDISSVGGIAGESGENAAYSNIRNKSVIRFNTGVSTWIYRVGGAFGDTEESFVTNVVNNAKVIARGNNVLESVGGLIGDTESTNTTNVNSTFTLRAEVDNSIEDRDTQNIGGYVGDDIEAGHRDIKSKADMRFVVVGDNPEGVETDIVGIGGFVGKDGENIYTRIHSDSVVSLEAGNGVNNSLNADVEIEDLEVRAVGGFAGERDDHSNYSRISSNTKLTVSDLPAKFIGGFVGSNEDYRGAILRNVVASGSVTLDENVSQSGAFFGESGPFQLINVISSFAFIPNGATNEIGYVFGVPYDGEEYDGEPIDALINRSHYKNAFFNNQLTGASSQEGTSLYGRKGKVLKSAKFLRANGFDLANVFNHTEGRLPVVKLNVPFATGSSAGESGQANSDTSISFGVRLSDGSRNFFVNLRNENARKTASLVVVRNGKVAKTIHTQVTNAVGNWYVNSKVAIKTGDVLRVNVGGKEISSLTVN